MLVFFLGVLAGVALTLTISWAIKRILWPGYLLSRRL